MEPTGAIAIDPYECEPGYRDARASGGGVLVLGRDGDDCTFRLVRALGRPPGGTERFATGDCRIDRASSAIVLDAPSAELEVPGATCVHHADRDRSQALGTDGAPPRWVALRSWEPAGSEQVTVRGSPEVDLTLRIWPPFAHRPDLARLERSGIVGPPRTLQIRGSWPAPLDALLAERDPRARTTRFSVPTDRGGILAQVVRDLPAGDYVAAEVEVTRAAPLPPVEPTTGPIVLDVGACIAGQGGLRYLGLGSIWLRIEGPRGADCVFTAYGEIEGGFSESECTLPRRTGTVTVTSGNTPGRVPGRCVVRRSGSELVDPSTTAAASVEASMQEVTVAGSYILRYLTLEQGRGAPLAAGQKVHVTLDVWGPQSAQPGFASAPPVEAPPAEAAVVKDRQVDLVVGEATYGAALDAALLGRSGIRLGGGDDTLQPGGRRRYAIRTEAVGRFHRLFSDTPLLTDQFLLVEVQVAEVPSQP